MERGGNFEGLAEGKAWLVLYELHTLRYSAMSVHTTRFDPSERENPPPEVKTMPDAILLPADATTVPEEILTQRGLDLMTKEQAVREQFQGMFPGGAVVPVGQAYMYVVEMCEVARTAFHGEADLVDEQGEPLASEAILPGEEVVEAMVEDFVRHKRQRCVPLEQWFQTLVA